MMFYGLNSPACEIKADSCIGDINSQPQYLTFAGPCRDETGGASSNKTERYGKA